jgi:uncharacterized protein YebE (UPF0316 family)
METTFLDSALFTHLVLPILIFLARIGDVSIGTMRIIFVSKGKRNIAPFLGFFEVLIWITAISKIMENLDDYINYVAYAAGFATGNFIGMFIEERLAVGIQLIRIITHQQGLELVKRLNSVGYGATTVEAEGAREKVHLIYSIVPRNDLKEVLEIIHNFNPKVFYTIEDVRATSEGIFPPKNHHKPLNVSLRLMRWRGGK